MYSSGSSFLSLGGTQGLETTGHYRQWKLLELGPQITFKSTFLDKSNKLIQMGLVLHKIVRAFTTLG